jgi:hypothetical protein
MVVVWRSAGGLFKPSRGSTPATQQPSPRGRARQRRASSTAIACARRWLGTLGIIDMYVRDELSPEGHQ